MTLRIVITILVAWLFQRILFLLLGRAERLLARAGRGGPYEVQRAHTLGLIAKSLVTVIVFGIAIVRSVAILGWDVMPILAGAGILGVVLGFGAQTFVRDLIAGVFILMEDQYGVGDLLEVNGRAGTVESISVRSTVLRDFNGYVHFVPNGEMKTVVNRSRGWNRQVVDVQIGVAENVDRAIDVCRRVAEEISTDPQWAPRLLEPVGVWGVEVLGGRELQIRTVVRTRPGPDGPETSRELRRRLQNALTGAGIHIGASQSIVMRSDTGTKPARGS